MWAVLSTVELASGHDPDGLRQALEASAAPAVAAIDGFLGATWTLSEDRTTGVGFYRFTTEAAARQRAGLLKVGDPAPGGATITGVRLLEVVLDHQA